MAWLKLRHWTWLVLLIGFVVGSIWLWNYAAVGAGVESALDKDKRNPKGVLTAHFAGYLDPSRLVLDLRVNPAGISCLDVMRVLFTAGRATASLRFDEIILSRRGKRVYLISGSYFRELGVEYLSGENPIYLMRTFPENVTGLDGTRAFPTWQGGWLGVLGNQMKDLNEFCRVWIGSDEADPLPKP